MSSKAEQSAVRVMTRVRPFNSRELGMNEKDYPMSVVAMEGKQVQLCGEGGKVKEVFDFHETFWSIPESQKQFSSASFADQTDVYEHTGKVAVEQALKGYHCCIFAYGQTGSGKTYTMLGSPDNPGIAPRLVDELFERVEGMTKAHRKGFEYNIGISFFEIYNERCKDLIDTLGASPRSRGLRRPRTQCDLSPTGANTSMSNMSPRPRSMSNMPSLRRQSSAASPKQGSRRCGFPGRESPKVVPRASPTSPSSPLLPARRANSLTPSSPGRPARRQSSLPSSPRRQSSTRKPAKGLVLEEKNIIFCESESDDNDSPFATRKPTSRRSFVASPGARRKVGSPASPGSPGRRQSRFVAFDDADDDTEYRELRVRHSPVYGVYVEGLTRLDRESGVATAEDVKSVIRSGMLHRATAETKMNATSSRSHAVFQLSVVAKNYITGVQRYSHINLVDLAGSERLKMSGAEGDRLYEATRINLSLSTLRRVIDILIENSMKKKKEPKAVPPYRESMLTWVLSETLGGNSKTLMLATVSPHVSNVEDTTNTLRYAVKAKQIVNNVRVNEEKTSVLLSAMLQEINTLRDQMKEEELEKGRFEQLQDEIVTRQEGVRQLQHDMAQSLNEIAEKQQRLQTAAALMQAKQEEAKQLEEENVVEEFENARRKTVMFEQNVMTEFMKVQEYKSQTRAAEEERMAVRQSAKEAFKRKSIVYVAAKETGIEKSLTANRALRQVFLAAVNQLNRDTATASLQTSVTALNGRITEALDETNRLALQTVQGGIQKDVLQAKCKGVEGECDEVERRTSTYASSSEAMAQSVEEECTPIERENEGLALQVEAKRVDVRGAQVGLDRAKNVATEKERTWLAKIALKRSDLEGRRKQLESLRAGLAATVEEVEAEREKVAKQSTQLAGARSATAEAHRAVSVEQATKTKLQDELIKVSSSLQRSIINNDAHRLQCDALETKRSDARDRHDELKAAVNKKFFPLTARQKPAEAEISDAMLQKFFGTSRTHDAPRVHTARGYAFSAATARGGASATQRVPVGPSAARVRSLSNERVRSLPGRASPSPPMRAATVTHEAPLSAKVRSFSHERPTRSSPLRESAAKRHVVGASR